MTLPTSDLSAELRCHCCEYDLRAHAQGKCPECGTSVAESRKLAAIPRRPVWRNSDPRWRRRMIAGAWVLTLLPLMSFLRWLEMDSKLTVPNVFRLPGAFTLRESFLTLVYEQLVFCIGVVLLFSKERGRRGGRLEWTRRWGVLCSYVVLLLCAVCALFLPALVLLGIGAMFQSMPPRFAPPATGFIVETSAAYLRYGPYPRPITQGVLVAFSSITILLACAPLYEALRSCGLKRAAVALLAPLALFSVLDPVHYVLYWLGRSAAPDVGQGIYFKPSMLVWGVPTGWFTSTADFLSFIVEVTKWGVIFLIAVRLSLAQIAATGQKKALTAPTTVPDGSSGITNEA